MKIYQILLIILALPLTMATDHYSFEHAESLKPLIKWRDYGPEAINKAVHENKPIFLLLTAPSWCYWCQVYESEEYLFNPRVVQFINENFIPIYVDADQRQDLTRKYLEGGWPSTTVFSPDMTRIFGFSGPRPVDNLLINLQSAVDSIKTKGFSNKISYNYRETPTIIPTEGQLKGLINSYGSFILQMHDPIYGGFGSGQKFPQGRALDFSLEIYENTKNVQFLKLVKKTLEGQYTKIDEIETNYNLFDPVEGGFHRYGTKQDYTPPHYEKMLYDNAKLLKAYSHLLQIDAQDPIAKEVVQKTDNYIKLNWYDSKNGGFYGNTDVHGEDKYYGQNPRPNEKPRVEETKYTDWNAEAIITYLDLYKTTNKDEYKQIAEKSLDFYSKNFDIKNGAYHYISPNGEKSVRGTLLDNSFLLLTFVEGYNTLGKEEYLESAKILASFSLKYLYDWNSGGFFERNSPDLELYAPGENIDLNKAASETGTMTLAMLKLYKQTNDPIYLNAGIKTLGSRVNNIGGGLDDGYYFVKSSQYILDNNLLKDLQNNKQQIEKIEAEHLENFWVNELIAKDPQPGVTGFAVSDEGLDKLSGPLPLLLIVALLAGLLSFASPCTLPILPAFIAFSMQSKQKNIKAMTISFFIGLVFIFTILGMTATFLGTFLNSQLSTFSQITGIGMIFFGLYILSGKGIKGLNIHPKKPTSYFGSFLFGIILGLSWTPCIGPILVAILLLASTTSSFLTGGFLLFSYGVGLALPLVAFSSYLGKINTGGGVWKFIKGKQIIFNVGNKQIPIHTTALLSGLLFIILGYLIFSGTLFTFNQYVTNTGLQKYIFTLEDKLLSWIK
jgi:uncharacterized protein YyaL (SSP411 family)/cytochrome c biogenesis protein CcdA